MPRVRSLPGHQTVDDRGHFGKARGRGHVGRNAGTGPSVSRLIDHPQDLST